MWLVSRAVLQTSGWTPLLVASENGHVECVWALLAGGAAIDQARVGCASSMARHRGPVVVVVGLMRIMMGSNLIIACSCTAAHV